MRNIIILILLFDWLQIISQEIVIEEYFNNNLMSIYQFSKSGDLKEVTNNKGNVGLVDSDLKYGLQLSGINFSIKKLQIGQIGNKIEEKYWGTTGKNDQNTYLGKRVIEELGELKIVRFYNSTEAMSYEQKIEQVNDSIVEKTKYYKKIIQLNELKKAKNIKLYVADTIQTEIEIEYRKDTIIHGFKKRYNIDLAGQPNSYFKIFKENKLVRYYSKTVLAIFDNTIKYRKRSGLIKNIKYGYSKMEFNYEIRKGNKILKNSSAKEHIINKINTRLLELKLLNPVNYYELKLE